MSVTLTRTEAYLTVQEYLAHYLRLSPDDNMGGVLSCVNPYLWSYGQSADPAVPSEWASAAAAVARRTVRAPSEAEAGADPALPEEKWLTALFPFLNGMWPVLGNFPLDDLLVLLAQSDVPVEGLGMSPWEMWLNATSPLAADAPGLGGA
jgi:hypothetical protein